MAAGRGPRVDERVRALAERVDEQVIDIEEDAQSMVDMEGDEQSMIRAAT